MFENIKTPRISLELPPSSLPLIAALLLALSLSATAAAQSQDIAGWKSRSIGGGATYTAVSSPDPEHVFMGGTQISLDGFKLVSNPQLYLSSNSGQSFRRLVLPKVEPENAFTPLYLHSVFFLSPDTGWVSIGKHVLRTTTGGNRQEDWSSVKLDSEIASLHFFSESVGIAAGENGAVFRSEDGGASWTPVSTPASSELFRQFWLGDCHGWMVGQKSCEIPGSASEPGGTPEKKPCDAEILYSSNAGLSWKQLPDFAQDFALGGVDGIFFLENGKTGFVAGHSDADKEEDRQAMLLKTTDGGQSFSKVELPGKVGRLKTDFFGMKNEKDLHPSNILAMYWENEQQGHLAARAFLNKEQGGDSSSGSSSEKTNWLLIDLRTSDGGATWSYNDRGEFTGSFTNMPSGDGDIGPGLLRDLETGWMPGSSNRIWAHLVSCTASEDCRSGYACGEGGHCHRAASTFSCQSPSGGDGGNDGQGGFGPGFWGDDEDGEGRELSDDAQGGCDCSSAPIAAGGWALGLVLLRRRRVSRRRNA